MHIATKFSTAVDSIDTPIRMVVSTSDVPIVGTPLKIRQRLEGIYSLKSRRITTTATIVTSLDHSLSS